MKTKILSIVILLGLIVPTLSAQTKTAASKATTTKSTCNLSGVVRYLFNDYQGYKPDIGASVYVVPKNEFDSILNVDDVKQYEKLSDIYMRYLQAKSVADNVPDDVIRRLSEYTTSVEAELNGIADKIFEKYQIGIKAKYEAVVDATGMYNIKILYGEYYVIFKSANRDRPTIMELTGRRKLSKLSATKETVIVSCDFDI